MELSDLLSGVPRHVARLPHPSKNRLTLYHEGALPLTLYHEGAVTSTAGTLGHP